MKRLIRSATRKHMSEDISHIIHIHMCDDINSAFMSLKSTAIMAATDDTTIDEYYSKFSDMQLLDLSDEEIHTIHDVRLIERIAKLDSSRLSKDQLLSLKDALSELQIIDKHDVETILSKLKTCTSVSYDRKHKKTNAFLFDDEGKFREQDCLDIIKNLEVEDYVASTRSYNPNFLGHNLIIFEPDADWELSNGIILHNLTVYVKLDVDETTGQCVALVSMHAVNRDDELPYR